MHVPVFNFCSASSAISRQLSWMGYEFVVAGTFHVPSAIQKPLVFEATAHGVCLLLSRRFNKFTTWERKATKGSVELEWAWTESKCY